MRLNLIPTKLGAGKTVKRPDHRQEHHESKLAEHLSQTLQSLLIGFFFLVAGAFCSEIIFSRFTSDRSLSHTLIP